MNIPICGRCGNPVEGEASINDVPYCHQEDVEITCYQRELFSRVGEEVEIIWSELEPLSDGSSGIRQVSILVFPKDNETLPPPRCLCNEGVQECDLHPGRLRTQEERIQFRMDFDKRYQEGIDRKRDAQQDS